MKTLCKINTLLTCTEDAPFVKGARELVHRIWYLPCKQQVYTAPIGSPQAPPKVILEQHKAWVKFWTPPDVAQKQKQKDVPLV